MKVLVQARDSGVIEAAAMDCHVYIMLVVVKRQPNVMTASGHHSATHAVAGVLLVGGNASTSVLALKPVQIHHISCS